jgi:hypothetical protein
VFLFIACAGLLAGPSARAGWVCAISADTASLAGTSGFVDFQLDPDNPPGSPGGSQPMHATIGVLATDGTLITPLTYPPLGDVTGSLPGPLTIRNTDLVNEFTQDFLFGSTLQLQVLLDGPAIERPAGGPSGTTFDLSFYDGSGSPLLSGDPSGVSLQVVVNPDGTTIVNNLATGNPPAVSASVKPSPEPSTLGLLALGTAAAVGTGLLRRGRP